MKYTMTVDAVQWLGDNSAEVMQFCDEHRPRDVRLQISAPEVSIVTRLDAPPVLIPTHCRIVNGISREPGPCCMAEHANLSDWLVIYPDGQTVLLSDYRFKELFKEKE